MKVYNLIIQGSSHRNELVHCAVCKKAFVWLQAKENKPGRYISICAECRKQKNAK